MNALLANPAIEGAIAAILLSMPSLIVALAAYIKGKTVAAQQGEQIAGLQRQQDKQSAVLVTPVAATPAPVVAAQPPAGAGLAPLTVPPWSQTADVGTVALSATGTIDCGYECVAMCLRITTGVQVPASYLRWLVKGPGDTSLATADDLVAAFALNEHQAHRRDVPVDALKIELSHSMAAREPAIILGRWLSPEGHWMVCEETDEQKGVLFRDPWGGPQYWLPWPVVQQRYAGTYVHVDERAAYSP